MPCVRTGAKKYGRKVRTGAKPYKVGRKMAKKRKKR